MVVHVLISDLNLVLVVALLLESRIIDIEIVITIAAYEL